MKLYIVGFGCGSYEGMTLGAKLAIERSDLIVGYTVYAGLIRQYFPDKEYFCTGMRQELDRVKAALEQAAGGRKVSLICSGDSGGNRARNRRDNPGCGIYSCTGRYAR